MSAVQSKRVAEPETRSPKAQQILEAARRLFCEQGYGTTSMDAIAREAGVSKATLYAHFAGKEDLFAAMMERACRHMWDRFAQSDLERQEIGEALHNIGCELAAHILSSEAQAIYRLVVAESPRFPEVGRIFYEQGPRRGLGRLAEFLRAKSARGVLRVEDPQLAAEQFGSLVRGIVSLRQMVGIEGEPTPEGIDRIVRPAVHMMLCTYLPGRWSAA
jgi:AcrR family transcriptional regulator